MADIKEINGKYYDFSAGGNESFLITAKELKNVGIKNYYFMLRIDNPRVADINPFNPNITRQEILALMEEYKNNIWTFMRTAVRVRTDAGIVPYTLHRGLAAVTWCFEHCQDNCICESRQTYKTTGIIAGPIQWAFQTSSNLNMHFFGKETENTKRNLGHLKSDIELLPEWLQFKRYMDIDGKMKKARQASESIENNLLHNTVTIHPKAQSLSHAQNLARGGSGAIIYYDEVEHTPFIGEILSNSAPLFKTASDNAARAGKPYCRLMSCTPGNLDTREGRDSSPIIKSMIPWTEKIYDMTEEEIKEYKSAYKDEYHNSEENHTREVIDVYYIEYQYFQVRKTYEWVQEQYALSGDKMAIRREILLQRLRGNTESPISPEDIEYLISNMKKSTRDMLLCGKWLYKLYDHGAGYRNGRPQDLDPDIPYLVGIDPAGGGSGDNFAVTILNPLNLQIAAEFKSPYISGPNAVRMIIELIHDYIPRGVLIPERNSMGIYLLQMLLETDVRDNIYWSESQRQLEEITEEDYGSDNHLKALSQQYKKYGTFVSPKVRKAMFELLFQHIAEAKDILNTEYLVDDLCKLVRTSTGRIEASAGEHDDCVLSYLHTIYIYYTGDNLATFGIDRSVNPIFGSINDNNLEDPQQSAAQAVMGINNQTPLSYNEYVMQDMARVETEVKTLVDRFSFVRSDQYKRSNNPDNKSTVDISPSFFDMINDI